MEINTGQIKFDLGMLEQQARTQLLEVFKHLLAQGNKTITKDALTITDEDGTLQHICCINPDLTLTVREFDDEPYFDKITVEQIDIYEVLSLLDFINDKVLIS